MGSCKSRDEGAIETDREGLQFFVAKRKQVGLAWDGKRVSGQACARFPGFRAASSQGGAASSQGAKHRIRRSPWFVFVFHSDLNLWISRFASASLKKGRGISHIPK